MNEMNMNTNTRVNVLKKGPERVNYYSIKNIQDDLFEVSMLRDSNGVRVEKYREKIEVDYSNEDGIKYFADLKNLLQKGLAQNELNAPFHEDEIREGIVEFKSNDESIVILMEQQNVDYLLNADKFLDNKNIGR